MPYILLIVVNFFFLGCSSHLLPEDKVAKNLTFSIKDLINKNKLDVVNYDYVKHVVGIGTPENAKAILSI